MTSWHTFFSSHNFFVAEILRHEKEQKLKLKQPFLIKEICSTKQVSQKQIEAGVASAWYIRQTHQKCCEC